MASLDIKDAYYTVNVCPSNRKYLKFEWREKLFQYTALPMGYSASPRILTKIMKPIFAKLRQAGFTVTGYIDDIFIQGDTFDQCQKAVQTTADLLESSGFIINREKLARTTCHTITFLGLIINSNAMTVKLPDNKICQIVEMCGKKT